MLAKSNTFICKSYSIIAKFYKCWPLMTLTFEMSTGGFKQVSSSSLSPTWSASCGTVWCSPMTSGFKSWSEWDLCFLLLCEKNVTYIFVLNVHPAKTHSTVSWCLRWLPRCRKYSFLVECFDEQIKHEKQRTTSGLLALSSGWYLERCVRRALKVLNEHGQSWTRQGTEFPTSNVLCCSL